ncbi:MULTISPECIES: hypothetical protein [Myxococcus]|uniref:hypothetical protein n=1 Tax=Myxococcus TaxID=32 RepID=UPI0011422014|nr:MULTISPECIES: hypothetical protein [Myxococcus]MCK8503407.1 hypothetical protein [Myxococcus fulvus]
MSKSTESSPGNSQSHAFRLGNRPDILTILVLAAAGRLEELAGRPAAGQTGVTLRWAIRVWHMLDPVCFPSPNLDDYAMVNAVEAVHYRGKTGRTEGTEQEIRAEGNLRRLRGVLAGYDCIVALGQSAMTAVEAAGSEALYSGNHPSLQALNRMYVSSERTPVERRADRVAQWARTVMA